MFTTPLSSAPGDLVSPALAGQVGQSGPLSGLDPQQPYSPAAPLTRPPGLDPDGPTFPSPRKLVAEGLDPTEVGTQMVANSLSKLGKQSISMMSFSGKRDDARAWRFVFGTKMEDIFGDPAKRLLSGDTPYSAKEWSLMETWKRVCVQETDKAIHGLMLITIQRETVTGKALTEEIMNNTDKGMCIGRSAMKLMKFIMEAPLNISYDEAKVILAEIDNMVISVNDTPEEMRSMCSELRSKWNSIPAAFRGDDYGLYEKLINLHPKVCENKREMLEITLHTRRSMGESLPPYEVIAKGVIAAVINYKINYNNINLQQALAIHPGGGKRGCLNCGSKDHDNWECKYRCTDCGKGFCGSFITKECPCGKGDSLPPNEEIKNIKGTPIPAKLYEQLQDADKTMRERKKTDEGKGTTLMATDVWGGLTGNGYRGNHTFMIHDDDETAKTTTKQMPTGSWHSTPPDE